MNTEDYELTEDTDFKTVFEQIGTPNRISDSVSLNMTFEHNGVKYKVVGIRRRGAFENNSITCIDLGGGLQIDFWIVANIVIDLQPGEFINHPQNINGYLLEKVKGDLTDIRVAGFRNAEDAALFMQRIKSFEDIELVFQTLLSELESELTGEEVEELILSMDVLGLNRFDIHALGKVKHELERKIQNLKPIIHFDKFQRLSKRVSDKEVRRIYPNGLSTMGRIYSFEIDLNDIKDFMLENGLMEIVNPSDNLDNLPFFIAIPESAIKEIAEMNRNTIFSDTNSNLVEQEDITIATVGDRFILKMTSTPIVRAIRR